MKQRPHAWLVVGCSSGRAVELPDRQMLATMAFPIKGTSADARRAARKFRPLMSVFLWVLRPVAARSAERHRRPLNRKWLIVFQPRRLSPSRWRWVMFTIIKHSTGCARDGRERGVLHSPGLSLIADYIAGRAAPWPSAFTPAAFISSGASAASAAGGAGHFLARGFRELGSSASPMPSCFSFFAGKKRPRCGGTMARDE